MLLGMLKLLFLFTFFDFISSEGYFAIVGSNLIRHEKKYQVSIISQGYGTYPTFDIAIRDSRKIDYESDNTYFEKVKNVTLNGKLQTLKFDLKDQPIGDYDLEVKMKSNDYFKKASRLHMNTKRYSVFIQTDKPLYKPSDKVRFRVLILNSETKPIKTSKVQVHITDGDDYKIKQYNDVNLPKGVFQDELQLSDPALGTWKIHVITEGEETEAAFAVAEQSSEEFELEIESQRAVEKVNVAVKVKHLLGKTAKGNLTISTKLYRYWREEKKASKTVEIIGEKSVEFTYQEVGPESEFEEILLLVSFVEENSRRRFNATHVIARNNTRSHQPTFSVDKILKTFKPGLPFSVCTTLRKDANVTNANNLVKFKIRYFYDFLRQCEDRYPYRYGGNFGPGRWGDPRTLECIEETSYEEIKEAPLLDGVARIEFETPLNTTKVFVSGQYLDEVERLHELKPEDAVSEELIQVKLVNDKARLSEKVKINVTTTHEVYSVTYQVIAKGNIVVSEMVKVPGLKNFQIQFSPTLKMIPYASVIVFYITPQGHIASHWLTIEFENELGNFIDIQVSKNQAKPGEALEITINAKPNSYIGLLAIEETELQGNNIDEFTLFHKLKAYYQHDNRNNAATKYEWINADSLIFRDFELSGTAIITNARKKYKDSSIPRYKPDEWDEEIVGDRIRIATETDYYRDSLVEEPSLPKKFPEVWFFDNLTFDAMTTNLTIIKHLPATVNKSWIITGFSLESITGLGLSKYPVKVTTFKPLHATISLPNSIKLGEVLSFPINVFNYLDTDQEAEIGLSNGGDEFEFSEVNESENKVQKREPGLGNDFKKSFVAKAQKSSTVTFIIRPLKVGDIKIKVQVISIGVSETAESILTVEYEGVTQYVNKAIFIDLREMREYQTNISVSIPSNVVPGSLKVKAIATSEILALPLKNLDNLIKLPLTPTEQMLEFVLNIILLDYFESNQMVTPEIETQAKTIMETAYRHFLNCSRSDGSFSTFGNKDESGSTWLTAYAAKFLLQASKKTSIYDEIIGRALEFLTNIQAQNGSFPEVGQVSYTNMQDEIALTAYILIIFLENPNLASNYQEVIDEAIEFIVMNIEGVKNDYSLAIANYALQLGKIETKDYFLSKLDDALVMDNEKKHWECLFSEVDSPNSLNIETIAYVLQAFIEAGRNIEGESIMKCLVTQLNENGGIHSSQDTVVALEALSNSASRVNSEHTNFAIEISYGDKDSLAMNVNASLRKEGFQVHEHELPEDARNFVVVAHGEGYGVLQISYKYNTIVAEESKHFVLEPEITDSDNFFLQLKVCASSTPGMSTATSNMAVMEITLPSGFKFDSQSIPELIQNEKIKKINTENGENVVIVYFDEIRSTKVCPEFKAYRAFGVAQQKPGNVVIYSYYDKSRQATSFYNSPEFSLCDICDGDKNCEKNCNIF